MEIKSYANTQTKEEENKALVLKAFDSLIRFSTRKTLPRQQNTSLKDISQHSARGRRNNYLNQKIC
jgi:hypothetical protein